LDETTRKEIIRKAIERNNQRPQNIIDKKKELDNKQKELENKQKELENRQKDMNQMKPLTAKFIALNDEL